ncbi:MAG: restriction endonuclease subunit S [Peptoniphilus duerdenii]|uniref:restriction endonuclease subunit S n=1 Tax=Peptoniphilus duerdenii TaxID=507750 RepID=UPI00254EED71|nr:restriction endonuclease subunit S [Peptoniphilus duerdenii]MDK8275696.1 restriction endonuclease subunit S [Peptoniphilus duerdenii]
MSKIDELLKDEKVEWKRLGDVCDIIRGVRVTKKDLLKNGKYPVVSGGTGYMGYINEYNRDENTITIAQYGSAGYVNWQYEKFWANDVCFSVYPNENINKRYLYHFLLDKQNYLYSISNKSAIPYSISREKILKIIIPIPTLETQERIVKILDKFTECVTELQAKLQAELQARVKQYEYYRDKLLNENYLSKTSENIFKNYKNSFENIKLKDIATITRGKRLVRSELEEKGRFPVFQNSLKPLGYYHMNNFSGDKTCLISAGAAGDIFYAEEDFWAADDVFVIDSSSVVNKYIYYYLLNKQYMIKSKVRKASIPRISRDEIKKIEILVPTIELQKKIVEILDKFQSLVSETKGLLPQEIEQRQKQYEFYREKLFNFDDKVVNTHTHTHTINF